MQHGARTEDYKGKHLVIADDMPGVSAGAAAGGDRFTGCLAFLDTGLIALGDANAIRHGIDANASHDDVTKNADLMHLVSDAANGSNAWAVGQVDQMMQQANLPQEVQQIRDRIAIKYLSVSAYVNASITGNIRAEARDQEAGDQLRSAVNGFLAAGQLMAGRDTKLEAMLKTLQVTGSGTTVMMTFTVPPEMLDFVNGVAGLSNLMNHDAAKSHADTPDKTDTSKTPPARRINK